MSIYDPTGTLYSCAAASSMFAAVITLQSYLKSSRSLKDIPQILTQLADFRCLLLCSSPFIFVPISWYIEPTPLFHVMFLTGMVFNQVITTSITHNARLKEFFNHKQTSDYVAEIRSAVMEDPEMKRLLQNKSQRLNSSRTEFQKLSKTDRWNYLKLNVCIHVWIVR